MASAAAHLACAREIEHILGFCDNAFYQGSILPDVLATHNSHFKKDGTCCTVPDLERFWKESQLTGFIKLGYASHLLMDWHFLERFCPRQIPDFKDRSMFTDDGIYRDYSYLNYLIIKYFQINLERVDRVLEACGKLEGTNPMKVQLHHYWVHNADDRGLTTYIHYEPFVNFISDTARLIVKDFRFRSLATRLLNYP